MLMAAVRWLKRLHNSEMPVRALNVSGDIFHGLKNVITRKTGEGS